MDENNNLNESENIVNSNIVDDNIINSDTTLDSSIENSDVNQESDLVTQNLEENSTLLNSNDEIKSTLDLGEENKVLIEENEVTHNNVDLNEVPNIKEPEISKEVIDKKETKKSGGLLPILIIIIIGLLAFIVYDRFIATEDKPETPKTEIVDKKEEEKEPNTTQKTDEEIVKELYLEKLKQPREQCKLVDYKVDSVKILTEEERNEIIKIDVNEKYYQNATDKDIFATITFSTKFEDINENGCLAGNGSIDGNWLNGQTRCLYIKYENGNYKIDVEGTGW